MEMCKKYNDKKIFICHVIGMNNEYSILAKNDKEAKKILKLKSLILMKMNLVLE